MRTALRYIVVLTGVFGGGIVATGLLTDWNNALELAKCIGFMVCFGLLMLPLAMAVPKGEW
jgi:hypothetical protein